MSQVRTIELTLHIEDAFVRALYARWWRVPELAEEFGISQASVKKYLRLVSRKTRLFCRYEIDVPYQPKSYRLFVEARKVRSR